MSTVAAQTPAVVIELAALKLHAGLTYQTALPAWDNLPHGHFRDNPLDVRLILSAPQRDS